jgi:hypothetical protein
MGGGARAWPLRGEHPRAPARRARGAVRRAGRPLRRLANTAADGIPVLADTPRARLRRRQHPAGTTPSSSAGSRRACAPRPAWDTVSLRVTGTPRCARARAVGDRGPKPDRLIAHRSPPGVHMQRVAPLSAPSSKAGTRRAGRRLARSEPRG